MSSGLPRSFERYIGIPWVEDGAAFAGSHCWGLIRLAYMQERSIALPEFGGVSPSDLVAIARAMGQGSQTEPWTRVIGPWQAFDVVLMRGDRRFTPREFKDDPTHCGFAVGETQLIHVERSTDSVCVEAGTPAVARRILGVYRHRDLQQELPI